MAPHIQLQVGGAAVIPEQSRRRRCAPLWISGGMAVASAVLIVAGPKVLFFAATVLPVWIIAGVLLVPAVALLVTSRACSRLARGVVAATVALAGVLCLGGSVFTGSYRIVEPIGPEGCRVIVKEDGLIDTSGDVWEAGGFRLGRHIGTYWADDPYRPVETGNYSLVWDGGAGIFTVRGDEQNTVGMGFPGSGQDKPLRVECAGAKP